VDPNLTIEEFEHAGCVVRVGWDDCYAPEWTNPRHHDGNFGVIVMRNIRDMEGALGPEDEMWDESQVTCERCDGTGEAPDRESPLGVSECPDCIMGEVTIDQLEYARSEGARVAVPIYYVAHGPQHGVRTNKLNVIGDAELERADGVIFDTPNAVRLLRWEREPDEKLREALASELEVWNWYLEGRVYAYEVEHHGIIVDSCGGMLAEDEEYAKSEAIAHAEAHAKGWHESATSD